MENKNAQSSNTPESAADAQELWNKNKKEFSLWALSLVGAKPVERGDKIYGMLGFVERGNEDV